MSEIERDGASNDDRELGRKRSGERKRDVAEDENVRELLIYTTCVLDYICHIVELIKKSNKAKKKEGQTEQILNITMASCTLHSGIATHKLFSNMVYTFNHLLVVSVIKWRTDGIKSPQR